MSKFDGSYRREQLLPLVDKKVHCTGEFAGVNIRKSEYGNTVTILFHNVTLENDINCDHVWVFFNKNFKHLNIRMGCIMEFDAIVQRYRHEDRLGIGDCSNIRIISNGMQPNEKMSLKVNTIKYDNSSNDKIPKIPAHVAFLKEYGIKSGTRVDIVYDENKNKTRDKVFLSVFINGEKVNIKGEAYFDPANKHGIVLGKYFIPVKEGSCRNLSLMYLKQACAA